MIKIIVDSTSEITIEEAKEMGVTLIPMTVQVDGQEYVVGKNLTTEEFYEKLARAKELPKTTQINAATYEYYIRPIVENNDQAFVMCLSSGLSGSFNSLQIAKNEIDSPNVEIFDTETVTFAYKALVVEALKLVQSGVTMQELVQKMNVLKSKLRLYAIIDNVKYLIKGGRLSVGKGIIVTALNIKPIVTIKDKKLEMINKSIGFGMGAKILCKYIKNVDTSKALYYGHSNAPQMAINLKNIIFERTGIEFKNICNIGPVIGTHAGPNCVGVVFFEK